MARLIGKRTGEMHLALAAEPDDHRFSPEPFSLLYQRSLYHSMRTLTRRVFDLLNRNLSGMSPNIRSKATVVAPLEKEIIAHFSRLFSKKIPSVKIRVHGDYHLGQVLFTGNDFVIIDFEGEPARSIGERRLKRSPLRDVAGMIRSFHYPAYSILYGTKTFSPEEIAVLEPWAECWYKFVASAFLRTYLETVKNASFIPSKDEDLELLLNAYLLEKAIYEVAYELNNRPDWVTIPLKGIADLMGVAQ
jgi:maltose alpha-D-glucosyltransferase/alpha-amylase